MNTIRLGLWGPSRSGKTTYLLALRLASRPPATTAWQIVGLDDDSERFLAWKNNPLRDKRFPPASQTVDGYRWAISADRSGDSDFKPIAFELDVLDPPGTIFEPGYQGPIEDIEKLGHHFLSCDGLLYLYDPLNDDTMDSVDLLLNQLARARLTEGRAGARLEQHLAICVAKFDDPQIFGPAAKNGWVDPQNPPLPKNPQAYFEHITDELVLRAIQSYFQAKRTRYYVTSSIGFKRNGAGEIDLDDYANVLVVDGEPQIIGEVRPINVLEPLVWLARSIAMDRWRATERQLRQEREQNRPPSPPWKPPRTSRWSRS